MRFAALALSLGSAFAQIQPETRALEQRLAGDLARGVELWRESWAKRKQSAQKGQAEGYAFVAMAALHAKTSQERYLAWAREDMLWMAERGWLIHPFHVAPFIEAFIYLREGGKLGAAERRSVEDLIRATLRSQYEYPDWGAHNRSTIAAAGYYRAAEAIPADPEAPKWKRYGDALMSESWGRWSVEDASMYNPFWLFHVIRGAEATRRLDELMGFITTRYYFEFYSRLLAPNDMLPDFGDGEWTSFWEFYFADLMRAGSYYRNGRYLDAARRLYNAHATRPLSGYQLYCVAASLNWLDTSIPITPLKLTQSEEAIEDLVSKKIVFRNDNGRESSYLLLNYRDQGSYGRFTRDYLNQVLAAYEEKPHHGHADENSVVMLMDGGTVLLTDGGYRPGDDYFGGWRADVYHNRVVARAGWPMYGDVFDFLEGNRLYSPVETEKVHFARLGALDYSRTRLRDTTLGYTADRIILFAVETGMYIVVDSIRVDKAGHRTFANVWHPDDILKQGDGWVVAWTPKIHIRTDAWDNPHTRELLIRFVENRDAVRATKSIRRKWHESAVFYEHASNWFFEGQRLTFVTVLMPHAPGKFDEKMLDAVRVIPGSNREHRSLGLRFEIGGRPVTVGLKLDQNIGLTNYKGRPMWDYEAGALDYGPLRTDADFAFVVDKGGQLEYGLMYAARLDYEGKTLFEMPVTRVIYQGPISYKVPDARAKMPLYHEVTKR